MVYQLAPDDRLAYRFLERSPEHSLMMLRSLRKGARSGFAAFVDNPEQVGALMLVERPDWKDANRPPTRIQLDALDARSAVTLLSWLPPVGRVQVFSYRPWLHDLLLQLFQSEQVEQRVHCLIQPRLFRQRASHVKVREIGLGESGVLQQIADPKATDQAHRLFGVLEGERLLAYAALSRPDGDYVSVQALYVKEDARRLGLGTAVLSAATQAGLDAGKVVSCGLPVEDVPSLHILADLGYAPACREWMIEGHRLS